MFFLNWKVKYYVFQVLENIKYVTSVRSSLVIQTTLLIAAEIKSKSMTAES